MCAFLWFCTRFVSVACFHKLLQGFEAPGQGHTVRLQEGLTAVLKGGSGGGTANKREKEGVQWRGPECRHLRPMYISKRRAWWPHCQGSSRVKESPVRLPEIPPLRRLLWSRARTLDSVHDLQRLAKLHAVKDIPVALARMSNQLQKGSTSRRDGVFHQFWVFPLWSLPCHQCRSSLLTVTTSCDPAGELVAFRVTVVRAGLWGTRSIHRMDGKRQAR